MQLKMIDMKVYFILLKNEKGQGILEYALLLIFIVGIVSTTLYTTQGGGVVYMSIKNVFGLIKKYFTS